MPGQNSNNQEMLDCATSALARMKKHGNRATPDAYEVWLSYCTGKNSDLKADIDALLDLHSTVTDQDLEDLHARHLRETSGEQEIGESTARIQEAVDQVLAVVGSVSIWLLGARAYLVISIASVAGLLRYEDGVVADARVAVGACSPVPIRLPSLERALIGQPAGALAAAIRPEHFAGLAPIDDVRATAAYRSYAVTTLVLRMFDGWGTQG